MSVHTLSYDEKPGVQAIGTTTDDRPSIPGTDRYSTIWRDYEYVRFGTLSLLVGIDLLTGEAIPYISETHKSSDFVHFMEMLDTKYPAGDNIRLILDNHSAHTSQETQKYLNNHKNIGIKQNRFIKQIMQSCFLQWCYHKHLPLPCIYNRKQFIIIFFCFVLFSKKIVNNIHIQFKSQCILENIFS